MSVEQHTPFAAAAAFIAEQPQPRVTVPARCVLVGPTAVEVRLGGRAITVGEPQALGGQGTAPTPEQDALAALGACETITFRYWSGRLAIPLDELRLEVRGDIDPGASLGLAHGVRPRYGAVRIAVRVWGPAPAERYDQLLGAVDEHASVLDVFRNEVRVETIDGGLRVGRSGRRAGGAAAVLLLTGDDAVAPPSAPPPHPRSVTMSVYWYPQDAAAATAAYRVLSTLVPALDAICRAESHSLRLDIPMARTFLDPYLDLPTRRTAG